MTHITVIARRAILYTHALALRPGPSNLARPSWPVRPGPSALACPPLPVRPRPGSSALALARPPWPVGPGSFALARPPSVVGGGQGGRAGHRLAGLVRVLSNGKQFMITRKHFCIEVKSRRRNVISFTLLRRQYPLRLCCAMTFNKSQGQTLNRVSIDLRSHAFTHGQLYVALGRATKREDVLCLVTDEQRSCDNEDYFLTANVVHDVLLRGVL